MGQGVTALEVSPSGKHLVTVVRRAPNYVWIWFTVDFENPMLMAVLSHTGAVRDVKWDDTGDNLLVSYFSMNRDYISIWNSTQQTPQPFTLDQDLQLRGVRWIPGTPKSLLTWTFEEFMVNSLSDIGKQDSPEYVHQPDEHSFDERLGSPRHLQDDDTPIRQLADGVQQQEWGDPAANYQLEDTFHHLSLRRG